VLVNFRVSGLALAAPAAQSGATFCEENIKMARLSRPLLPAVVLLIGLPMLAGCSSFGSNPFAPVAAAPPPPPPVVPPSVHSEEIVGGWGLAAYHREQDRMRTEVAAKGQCSNPYPIEASASGGVMMYGHDNSQKQEMTLKGSPEGKTYLGPGTSLAPTEDREIVSFDGRVMILKWVDPEVASRYGNMVLVRCGVDAPERTARAKRRSAVVSQ
jgi:hypothetical protein